MKLSEYKDSSLKIHHHKNEGGGKCGHGFQNGKGS
jgi:hypothetical protein